MILTLYTNNGVAHSITFEGAVALVMAEKFLTGDQAETLINATYEPIKLHNGELRKTYKGD